MGKIVKGTLSPSFAAGVEQRWEYVGKFGYTTGMGSHVARARTRDAVGKTTLRLEVYMDEDWPRVAALPRCSPEARSLARDFVQMEVGSDWAVSLKRTISQKMRAHIWYFALSACPDLAHPGSNLTHTDAEIDYEIHFVQPNGSELSYELQWMPCVTLLVVLSLSGFLVHFARRCRRVLDSAGDIHPMIWALAGTVLLQWTAEVSHLCHLQFYEREGLGESALEDAANMLLMLSQVASCTLLIAIAKGYTLLKDTSIDSVKRIAAFVAIPHAILVGHNSLQGDHVDKHHENGGAAGLALVLVRLGLFAWFVMSTRAMQQQSQSMRLQDFLQRFQIAASAYFLSYPALFFIVQVFAPYLQHPILHLGTATMQTCVAFWLAELFLSRGAYFQISTLSSSLLPGSFVGARAASKRD